MSDSFNVKLNQALRQEISAITPNRVDDLLARLGEQSAPQAAPVAEAAASKRKTYRPRWQLLAAAMLALVLLGSGIFYGVMRGQRSVVILDADASVAFSVDGFDRVRSVRLEDARAASVVDSGRLVGKKLDKAVADAAEQLIAADVLSAEDNAVLLSVQESGAKRSAALAEKASKALGAVAAKHAVAPIVLMQSIPENASSLAGASVGRTAYVNRLFDGVADGKTAELVHATLEELLYFSYDKSLTPAQVTAEGKLNESVFRTAEDAVDIALADAGYTAAQAAASSLLGWEESNLVYLTTLDAGSRIGYYCISARTGEILNVFWEEAGTEIPEPTAPSVTPSILPPSSVPGYSGPTGPATPQTPSWDYGDVEDFFEFWDDLI